MSEIKFNNLGGNYNFYKPEVKQEAKEETQNLQKAPEQKNVKGEDVLNAMNLMGAQNFVQVSSKATIPPINLSEDRISSIEESMKAFEEGVGAYKDVIDNEFGDMFSEQTKLALAANMFAREE